MDAARGMLLFKLHTLNRSICLSLLLLAGMLLYRALFDAFPNLAVTTVKMVTP
jgi:hypothetical protein